MATYILKRKTYGSKLLDEYKPDTVKQVESLQDSGMMGAPGLAISTGRKAIGGLIDTVTGN